MKLDWKDPPPATRGPSSRFLGVEMIAALKKAKGRWARIYGPRSYSLASLIQRARARDPGLEATSRKEAQGYYLYARYVGNGKRQ